MNWYQYILLELYGTNWLASNILLLASKICFLSSHGLVGAGMNCRALSNRKILKTEAKFPS